MYYVCICMYIYIYYIHSQTHMYIYIYTHTHIIHVADTLKETKFLNHQTKLFLIKMLHLVEP